MAIPQSLVVCDEGLFCVSFVRRGHTRLQTPMREVGRFPLHKEGPWFVRPQLVLHQDCSIGTLQFSSVVNLKKPNQGTSPPAPVI